MQNCIFFDFFRRKVCVYEKFVVILHAFSPRMCTYTHMTRGKSMEYLINKHQFKQTTKCLQFNN